MDLMLTLLAFALAFVATTALAVYKGDEIETKFRGGTTLITYSVYGLILLLSTIGDPPASMWDAVFAPGFFVGWFVFQFGHARGWDVVVERILPGAWFAGICLYMGLWSLALHVLLSIPSLERHFLWPTSAA